MSPCSVPGRGQALSVRMRGTPGAALGTDITARGWLGTSPRSGPPAPLPAGRPPCGSSTRTPTCRPGLPSRSAPVSGIRPSSRRRSRGWTPPTCGAPFSVPASEIGRDGKPPPTPVCRSRRRPRVVPAAGRRAAFGFERGLTPSRDRSARAGRPRRGGDDTACRGQRSSSRPCPDLADGLSPSSHPRSASRSFSTASSSTRTPAVSSASGRPGSHGASARTPVRGGPAGSACTAAR